jgi:hypothetical protein
MAHYIAQERLYLTADRLRIVTEGDPEAASLLAAKGRRVDPDDVDRYGLRKERKPASETKERHPEEDKAAPQVSRAMKLQQAIPPESKRAKKVAKKAANRKL